MIAGLPLRPRRAPREPGYPARRRAPRAALLASAGLAAALLGGCGAASPPPASPAQREARADDGGGAPRPGASASAGRRPRATVDPAETGRLSGAVASPSYDEVRRALGGRLAALGQCYDRARAARPGLEGRIVVDLRCAVDRCLDVSVVEDGVSDPGLAACVETELTGMPVPGLSSSGEVTVRAPLVFTSPDEVPSPAAPSGP